MSDISMTDRVKLQATSNGIQARIIAKMIELSQVHGVPDDELGSILHMVNELVACERIMVHMIYND